MRKQKKKPYEFVNEDVVLLITGCICPNQNQRFLVLKDAEERLKQYLDSIRFYIESSPFTKIVFCDNSACSCDSVQELIDVAQKRNKTFEWLSFQGNHEKITEQGKGYGEGEIIHYALQNSALLRHAKSFAKVTGRLKIDNIHNVVTGAQAGRNYFNRDIYRGHGMDTRFYLCDKDYYCQHLIDLYTQTCELPGKEFALEDAFFRTLKKIKKYRAMNAYPAFKGISGGNGRDYSKMSSMAIRTYSFFCRINLFDLFCYFKLGVQKFWLKLTGKC